MTKRLCKNKFRFCGPPRHQKRGNAAHSKRFATSHARPSLAKRLECGAFHRFRTPAFPKCENCAPKLAAVFAPILRGQRTTDQPRDSGNIGNTAGVGVADLLPPGGGENSRTGVPRPVLPRFFAAPGSRTGGVPGPCRRRCLSGRPRGSSASDEWYGVGVPEPYRPYRGPRTEGGG